MMLIGYLSTLSCRAGDSVDVMISSSVAAVNVDLVRLIHGDDNPAGPGFIFQPIAEVASQTIAAQLQQTPIGSWGESIKPLQLASNLSWNVALWPTLLPHHEEQGILALPNAAITLVLDREGCLQLRHQQQCLVKSDVLKSRQWVQVSVTLSPQRCTLQLKTDTSCTSYHSKSGVNLPSHSTLLVATTQVDELGTQRFARNVYNGKLAQLSLALEQQPVAMWAAEQQMQSQQIPDTGVHGYHLRLINAPTRAMTGPDWSNVEHDWKQAPQQYDAVHFHDDDLADACWPVTTRLTVDANLKSGVYAVRLRGDGVNDDFIPLIVRPSAQQQPAKIAMVMATYTYIAYANEHLTEGDFEQGSEIPVQTGDWEDLVAIHQEWGKSHYDLHNDGSGVAYSSSLRPIPNMRPNYRFWGFHAPRRFSADLYMVWLLHQMGVDFDVLSEHDLHAEHATLLQPYQTVITGSHPEYYSGPMLDAYEQHVAAGGGLMYLGGDGFYWVTTPFDDLPHLLEVRKSEGLRHWDADPGERYHASTGELGGIWRSRGRSAHRLFGVGMGAHGWDNKAPGYRRSARSYQSDAAWVFAGIEEEVIGDFGLIMNGTSGDEIDRADSRFGTPEHAIILASSEPHSEWYVPVPEDVTTVSNKLNARYNRDVRSDMVLVEHSSGGAVFSVGSIIFTGAVPVNGGENNVATLLRNVIENFTARNQADI